MDRWAYPKPWKAAIISIEVGTASMETQVRTPNAIFGQPQRFLVPLFQRPYVWNEEQQWEPLWNDLKRVATRLLNNPLGKHEPHFLGAVVLQQVHSRTGELQE